MESKIYRSLISFDETANKYGQFDPIVTKEENLMVVEDMIRYPEVKSHTGVKKGLALCHGHNHSNKVFRIFTDINFWYYVDINPDNFPDYVADASDQIAMKYFPDKYFDCILFPFCQVILDNKLQYLDMLRNSYRILKDDGVVYSNALPKLFFKFLSKKKYQKLVSMTNEIIGIDNINNFNKISADGESNYSGIFMGMYHGPKWKILKKSKEALFFKWAERLMNKNDFRISRSVGKFLVMKKII